MAPSSHAGYSGAVVVTGGASGIGAATVLQLRRLGVTVGVIDLERPSQPDLSDVAFATADVSNQADLSTAFQSLQCSLGPIGHLVCAAGVGPRRTPSTELPTDEWRRMLAIHVDGTFFACQAFMRIGPPGEGSIVTIGSVAARAGLPERAAYVTAKGAIAALTRSLAVEWASQAIRVNCVHPGYVLTPMVRQGVESGLLTDDPAVHTAQGRMAEPSEIARVITFLLSTDASFVTGDGVVADGGFLITKLP